MTCSFLPFSSDLAEWTRFAVGVLAGGLISTYAAHRLQLRRTKRELTIRLVEGFSSLEAHDLRMKVWRLLEGVTDEAFDSIDGRVTDEERTAFRYVLGFFVQAGSLMQEGLIDRKLFFALSKRWMVELYDKPLSAMAAATEVEHYRVQKSNLAALGEAWKRWKSDTRK